MADAQAKGADDGADCAPPGDAASWASRTRRSSMNQFVAVPSQYQRSDLIAWTVTAAALVLVLQLHLLTALLAGLLVHELVHLLVPRLRIRALGSEGPRLLAVTLIATAVIAGLAAAGFAATGFLRNSSDSIPALLERMAQIIEQSRGKLPAVVLDYLPADAEQLRVALAEWLRSNSGLLQGAGLDLGRALAHILVGMVIGALLALQRAKDPKDRRPLSDDLAKRASRLSGAFRRVVFAQMWISAINTFFTWCYLVLLLPAFGVELPLTKTLVAVTFIAGLLPILGNLISNTVIFIVSLSHSLWIALLSLAYLIVIHKLEYFLNARIIGSHINARAWELLVAMIVMEAAFGIPGLIAAPIFYAYFKEELRLKALV